MLLMAWIIGILTGGLAVKFYPVLKKMDWYFLILSIIWYAFGIFGTAFAATSFAEGEAKAGSMAIVIFGIIFVVLGIIIYLFGIRKQSESRKVSVDTKTAA